MNDEKALLIELANALDAASALAKMIAESEPVHVELKVDEQTFSRVAYRAIRDNPEASELSHADSEKTALSQSVSIHQDQQD